SLRLVVRVDRSRRAGDSVVTPRPLSAAHRGSTMSGYFDALMRSSGLTNEGPGPATASLQSNALEVAADPGAPTMEARAVAAPPMRPAAIRDAEPAEPVAPLPQRQERAVHQPGHERDDVELHRRNAPEARVELTTTPRVRSDARSTPDLSARLVRAAVRWIAADTSGAGSVSLRAPSAAPAREDARPIPTAVPDNVREATPIATPMVVEATAAPREPAHVPPPVEAARAVEPRQVHTAPVARDETVEISIGSIHVRVDAPPAQTIARPAMPSPVNNPSRVGGLPERSALSRRALRRI